MTTKSSTRTRAVFCRLALLSSEESRGEGYLLIRGRRVVGFEPKLPKSALAVDLPDGVLVPGFVSAHTHLAFSHLERPLRESRSFTGWITELLGAPKKTEAGPAAGAERLRRSGVTCVGDHDPDGSGAAALRAAGLRGCAFREFFAFEPNSDPPSAGRSSACVRVGLAPHAPYTVVERAATRAAKRGVPISVHLAETEEERRWLAQGDGPIEALLLARGRRPAMPWRASTPLTWLRRTGLLRRGTLIIHGNCLSDAELGELARVRVRAVHCPGTHRNFRRGDTPLRKWVRAGLPFALGVDSLASNSELSVLSEMHLLRRSDPWLDARAIVHAALEEGARALGRPEAGHLRPGAAADFVLLRSQVPRNLAARSRQEWVSELLCSLPPVAGTWLAADGWLDADR